MKNLVLSLFFYFLLFANCIIYAGANTLTVQYPAPSGSYNKLILKATTSSCSNPGSQGLLFMDTTTNTLKLCVNGQTTAVAFPQECFNRFCSGASCQPYCSGGTCTGNNEFTTNVCAPGFSQKTDTSSGTPVAVVDHFNIVAGGALVYSTVCCSN